MWSSMSSLVPWSTLRGWGMNRRLLHKYNPLLLCFSWKQNKMQKTEPAKQWHNRQRKQLHAYKRDKQVASMSRNTISGDEYLSAGSASPCWNASVHSSVQRTGTSTTAEWSRSPQESSDRHISGVSPTLCSVYTVKWKLNLGPFCICVTLTHLFNLSEAALHFFCIESLRVTVSDRSTFG